MPKNNSHIKLKPNIYSLERCELLFFKFHIEWLNRYSILKNVQLVWPTLAHIVLGDLRVFIVADDSCFL